MPTPHLPLLPESAAHTTRATAAWRLSRSATKESNQVRQARILENYKLRQHSRALAVSKREGVPCCRMIGSGPMSGKPQLVQTPQMFQQFESPRPDSPI
jgi:hypothetical protein